MMKKTLNIALIGLISIMLMMACAKKTPPTTTKPANNIINNNTSNSLIVGTWLHAKVKFSSGQTQDFTDPTKYFGQNYVKYNANGTYQEFGTKDMTGHLTNPTYTSAISTYTITTNNVLIKCCGNSIGDKIIQLDMHNLVFEINANQTEYYTK